MLNGIQNFLQFINDSWTALVVIFSLILTAALKIKSYFSNSNDKKIDIAKAQIKEIILKLITDAEVDYESWYKAGSIKRSQVIQQIFEDYPILSKISDQNIIIQWIDEIIDESLTTLRKIVENTNSEKK